MKASVIVLTALAATLMLRGQSAAFRHWVLAAALACAATTPLLERLGPSWQLPLARGTSIQHLAEATLPSAPSGAARPGVSIEEGMSPRSRRDGVRPVRNVSVSDFLGPIWWAGIGLSLSVLAIGLGRLRWLASRARPLRGERWSELARQIAREHGLRRPVQLLQSEHPSLLVTWGFARPKILLPAGAAGWPDDRKRIVLGHELAHIRRGDWVVQVAGEVLRCVYWFNPIIWLACRRLRLESERACDDAVLTRGVKGPDYAAHLLDVARALNRRRNWVPAPAITRGSSLRRRINAMLNDRLNRTPASRLARLGTAAALLALTVAVAAAQSFATFTGSLVDPLGGSLPGARVMLSNAQRQAKYEVTTDRFGRFEFVGLPPGDYTLETELLGFSKFRESLTVAGESVQRAIALQLGSLEETVSVKDGEDGTANTAVVAVQTGTPRPNPPCSPASRSDGATGGNIRPPRRIRNASLHYPQSLRGTGTGGEVIMDGHIALDGFIRDLQVRNDAHPDLANAAMAAVSEWQWDSTLLNCVPVEVFIKVTARFVGR